eukprot:2196242-Pyramimonas_sp.AAC.1
MMAVGAFRDRVLVRPCRRNTVVLPTATETRLDNRKLSLAKNPTICSCQYRSCGFHLQWKSP